jgi:Ca-activated chloride channel homolog
MRSHISRWALLAASLLTGVALLSSCAEGDMGTPESVPAPEAVVDDAPREIIRNADMALRVSDVRETTDRITSIVEQAGGRVSSRSLSMRGESPYADLTTRVPADRLDGVITAVSDLGEVITLGVVAEDVTTQGADLDARIDALQMSIDRLRDLLATADNTRDLLAIEAELTTRQAELDSIVAQREALTGAVALSTLTISVSPLSDMPSWTPPGFVAGLESGWGALRTLVAGLVTLAGFAVPFVGLALVLAIPIVLVVVLVRRRRVP